MQGAKARRLIGLINRTFSLTESKLSIFKTHVRPLLEYCTVVFSNMRQIDRFAIENVQRRFTKQLLGYSSPLNYMERCEILHLEPLWLRRLRMNLSFFCNIVKRTSCNSAPQVKTPSNYSLRHRDSMVLIPVSRTAMRSNFFIVKYSSLWNKLPPQLRSMSSASLLFKKEINKHLTVQKLIRMHDPYMSITRAYELGLGY